MVLSSGVVLKNGEYRIERVLGKGGFGITYLAYQIGLDRKVAIKEFFMSDFCNRDVDTSHVSVPSVGSKDTVEKFKVKFIKEAKNIASLNNPHIIRIYDIFENNGTAYYVMEYHDGGSLQGLIDRCGRLGEPEALGYIRQIADALQYIHKRNMNHLDVKPGNVLLDDEGNAVLIDFGLSKRYDAEGNQTSTTPVGISHGYAPLEQYKKGGVSMFSPVTDIYSLGATLYKLVIGNTPPEADVINEEGLPSFPAYVSPSVASTIEHAMQPVRKNRPQSIAEFLALLPSSYSSSTAETIIIAEVDESNVYPERKKPEKQVVETNASQSEDRKKKRSSWIFSLLAILISLGIGAGAYILFMDDKVNESADEEELLFDAGELYEQDLEYYESENQLRIGVEAVAATCPIDIDYGLIMKDVLLENGNVVYVCEMDEDIYDIEASKEPETQESMKTEILKSLLDNNDSDLKEFIKVVKGSEANIVYRYIGDTTGNKFDIIIENSEL